jgi:translation initiation factor IF-3
MFRGRESSHKDLGIVLATKIKASLADICEIERNNSMLGNRLIFVLTPKKV